MAFKIGVISDTHGLLRPEAERCLVGVDYILHGGDIGGPDIIDALSRIAPVTAIRGNVDRGGWAEAYPATVSVRFAGKCFYLVHDVKTLKIDPAAKGIDVVISGHSHVAKIEMRGRVLYLNPGSAGRRRFKIPITLAILNINGDGLCPIVQDLGVGRAGAIARQSHCLNGSSRMDEFYLARFVQAQNSVFAHVIDELSAGRKQSHWMWFIFPQIAGLGFSLMTQRYAIQSRSEAQAYLAHAVLGRRLIECTRLVVAVPQRTITDILGQPDDVKFKSSMTLFHEVSGQSIFADAIARFFSDGPDLRTLNILKSTD